MKFNAVIIAAAICAPLLGPTGALAQHVYPVKTIRMIVPQPPGGTSDFLARTIAQKMTEATGQQVVVDNRPGAGGNIGTEAVAKAAPDGYTLLTVPSSTLTVNPSLFAKLPFDPFTDFAPITIIAAIPNVLVVHPSLPVKTVKELIAFAKARPGMLSYASSGAGQSTHLAMELLKTMTQIDIVHIPYKGSSQALPDLVGGHVAMMFTNMPTSLPLVRAGKLRALGVTSLKRSSAMPELPTIDESGIRGFEITVWNGMLAPAGTPKEIVTRLNNIVVQALGSLDVSQRLANEGANAVGNTPEEFVAQMHRDVAKWAKLIKATGARPE